MKNKINIIIIIVVVLVFLAITTFGIYYYKQDIKLKQKLHKEEIATKECLKDYQRDSEAAVLEIEARDKKIKELEGKIKTLKTENERLKKN